MNGQTVPLTNLTLELADPFLAHVARFARDVAWRHRNAAADPARFRGALEGYYRAWSVSLGGMLPELDVRTVRAAVATYRNTHRALYRPRPRSAASGAAA